MRRVFKTDYFRGNHMVGESIGEFGGYRALTVLGQGAGSTVYEVQDPADGRLYALKLIPKNQPTDQRFIDQGVNEHEVGSSLDHPNLRKCIKVIRQGGLMSGGPTQVMLLMELVEGTTLEARRPRSRRLMIGVFKAAAAGLGAMHEAGIVHADMKPINILLTNSGGLKIIDYGQSCPINTVKTRIQGTLDYIAPEQVRRGAITARTDVYNLGATMYWCVTDHHPPTALRLRGTPGQPMPVVDNVLHDPREFNPHLPPALAGLILDCLQPNPADRPASMKDVSFRLDMALLQLQNEKRAAAREQAAAAAEPPIEAEILPEPVVVEADGSTRTLEPVILATSPDTVPVLDVASVVDAQQELDLPAPMPAELASAQPRD